MTEQLREQMLDAVHRRATRLAQITAPGHAARHVSVLLATAAHTLVCTLVVVIGERFLEEWLSWLFGRIHAEHGICPFCRTHPLREDRTMCQPCWDQIEAEDREVEQQVLMHDTPPMGRVS